MSLGRMMRANTWGRWLKNIGIGLLCHLGLLLVANNAYALACTSAVVTGNWGTAATWTSAGNCNRVPIAGDSVTIAAGHTITLNATTAVLASLTIEGTLTTAGTNASDIYLGGNLVNNGTLNMQISTGVNTIFLSGTNVVSTFSGTGTWLLDDIDLNGGTGGLACNTSCKLELSGSINLQSTSSALFAGNSTPNFTFNSLANATSTVTLSRAGTQTIAAVGVTYPNLVLGGSNTKTMGTANGQTITVLGGLTVNAGVTLSETSRNPIVNVGGAVNNAGTYTAGSGAHTIGGSFSNTGTYTGGAGAVSLAGNFSNTGAFTSGAGTWTFNGTAAQSITGTPTFTNLRINNAAGLTLATGNVTVGTLLTLTSGIVTTGTNTLINNSTTCVTTRTSGWVNGKVQLTVPATNPVTCTFPVGDANSYTPVDVTKTGTNTGTLIGSTTTGDHADTTAGTSGIDKSKSVNRYWTLTAGTLAAGTTYSAVFNFVAGDIDSGAATANFIATLKNGATWATQTTGTKAATSTQVTGLTSFGDFALGEALVVATTCYADTFTGADNAAPGANWSVGNKSQNVTGFTNPVIFGNRLRLTDAGTSRATWATLQKLIPAAGNKVTIEFDYFAYGGTGGDGFAIVLSDASIAPQAGAFGGSLGYAQKSNPGSDCTTVGGCPGFAGGWLGIGLDEYGNYSAATEGRYLGTAAAVANAIAIRGSGSGMSGYRYLTGAAVTPGVGTTTAHHYRIIVDHRDGTHAYTSVERDTAGGTNYTVLLGCANSGSTCANVLDVKDPGFSQNTVPTNWNLSFTGSSGGSTNIHEIDTLNVCTEKNLVTPTLHHIQVVHNGTACTTSPAAITIKACADAACTSLYQNSVTVTLTSTPGGTWAPVSPVTFTGGQTSVTLTDATARTDTLTVTASSPAAANVTTYSPTNQLTFSACSFDVVEVGKAAYTPIYTKLAGTPFNLNVLSLVGASQTVTAIELVDMSSGSCAAPNAVLGVTLSPLLSVAGVASFTANQGKTFSFTSADAAPNVRVRVKTATTTSCSTDNFAIRPAGFTLTALNTANAVLATSTLSTDTPTAVAGAAFSLKADAGFTGYNGTPKVNASLLAKALTTLTLGSLSTATFPAAISGVSTASGLTYSEVGNFALGVGAVYDDSFTLVDSTKASPECTSNLSNTANASGMFGCMFGNTTAFNVGRFVPDHFNTVVVQTGTSPALVPMACASGLTCPATFNGMVYSGQPFTVTVTAKNANDATTVNYDTTLGFAKTTTLSTWSALGGGTTLSNGSLAVTTPTTFAAGVATEAAEKYTFTTAPTAPTDVYIRAVDTDTVSSLRATATTSVEGGVKVVSGRVKIPNAYGSELLPLSLAAIVQYYNGSTWITNLMDNATALAFPATFTVGTGSASVTLSPVSGIVSGGSLNVLLSKPTAGTGKATVSPTSAPSYLSVISGQATFGVYKARKEIIYMRENY